MSKNEWHGNPTGGWGHKECRKTEKRSYLYEDEGSKFSSKKQAYGRNYSMRIDGQQNGNRERGGGQFGYGREKLVSYDDGNELYDNSRHFSERRYNYMNQSGNFDINQNLHFESMEKSYNNMGDGKFEIVGDDSRSEEESSDSGIWSHQGNADQTRTFDHGWNRYRVQGRPWNPGGRGFRSTKRWRNGHSTGHREKSILQMSSKEKIHQFCFFLRNDVQKVNAIQTIENGLASSRLGLKSEYHVQECKTVGGKPHFTGVLKLSGVFMGRSFGINKKETKHGAYDTALDNLIHKSVDEIFQLLDPGIEAIRDEEDVSAELETNHNAQKCHVHISDADSVQTGNNNTQMINIPPGYEKQQVNVYQSGYGGSQQVTVNINLKEERRSSDSERGTEEEFYLRIQASRQDGRSAVDLEKISVKALQTEEGLQLIIKPMERVLGAKTVSISEGSIIIRLRPNNEDSISKLKAAIKNEELHRILGRMIKLEKVKSACSGCQVILDITACIPVEDFDGKNKSFTKQGSILMQFRPKLQDSNSRLKTAVETGDLQRILTRFAELKQVRSALHGSDLVLNVTASLPKAKETPSVSQIHSCKDQNLGELPENDGSNIPSNPLSERLIGLRSASCRLSDKMYKNWLKSASQSLNLNHIEPQPNTRLVSAHKSSLKFHPTPFDDQDKLGTSQAHEVFGSNGNKRPAKDRETFTQTDKIIVNERLESIKTGVLPSMAVPSNLGVIKQDVQHLFPEEILHMDARSIEMFKEALQCGKEKVYNIRVMVVGHRGVGKTTLVKRLLGETVDISKQNSTEGIEIHHCHVLRDTSLWKIHAQEANQNARLQRLVKLLCDRDEKLDIRSMQEVQTNAILQREAIPEAGDKVPLDINDPENENKSISLVQYIGQELKTISALPVTLYPVKVNQVYSVRHIEHDISDAVMSGREENTSGESRKMDPMMEFMQQVTESAHILQRSQEKTAALAMWEFAGQYLFYTTHQTFLTRRAIYLLTIDLSKQLCDHVVDDECFFDSEGTDVCKVHDLVEVWLNSIHSCAPSTESSTPPVILVGTHMDKLPHTCLQDHTTKYFEQIRLMLRDKPARLHLIDEDFVINNTLDNTHFDPRLEDLKRKIVEVASRQPYWGETVPARWLPLEQALMKLKASGLKIVPLNIVEEINRSGPVQIESKEELDLFLRFQHDIGTILYFSTEQLRKKIVLDPLWHIDALKSLITAKRFILMNNPTVIDKWLEFSEKGKLTMELIDAIWTKEKHKEFCENKGHIFLLLEQLNIVTRPRFYNEDGEIMKEEYLLAPCMLRQKTPPDIVSFDSNVQKESSSVLCYVFVNTFLPTPIFHRLLATCVAHWPIAKCKSENLIFCYCCIFDIDLSHRLAIYLKDYVIFLRVTKTGITDKTLFSNLCIKVRDFITWNLFKIIGSLGKSLCFELFLQCSLSTGADVASLIPVSLLLQNAEIACRPHNNSHAIVSHDLLKFWYEEKNYEHENQPVIERRKSSSSKEDQEDNGYSDANSLLTQEHVNHARLCNALTTVCSEAMRQILQKNVSSPHENIYQAIQANKTNLTSRRQVRPGQWQNALLNKYQCQIVFPDLHGQVTGTVDQFDISLLYIMIRNVSSVVAPLTGWGNPPRDQPRDTTLGASVERIHLLRNKVSGHSVSGQIGQKEFEEYWSMMGDILHDIENITGDRGYQIASDKCKNELITAYEACEQRKKY